MTEKGGYCLKHGKELGLSCPDCNREAGQQKVIDWMRKHETRGGMSSHFKEFCILITDEQLGAYLSKEGLA